MTAPLTCPACGASLVVGVEIPELYDGALFWQCGYGDVARVTGCGHRWHRWAEGHPLTARAERYANPPVADGA